MKKCGPGCEKDCSGVSGVYDQILENIERLSGQIDQAFEYLKYTEGERKSLVDSCNQYDWAGHESHSPPEFVSYMESNGQSFSWESAVGITHTAGSWDL